MGFRIKLIFLFLVLNYGVKSETVPEENLSKFVTKSFYDFRSTIVDAGLDPMEDATVRDLYVINPTFEIGGDVWDVSFFGFSNFDNVEILSNITFNTSANYMASGNYKLMFEVPSTLTGKFRLSGSANLEDGSKIPLSGEGNWTIRTTGFRNDTNYFTVKWTDEVIDPSSSYSSFTLHDSTLDIPGLIPDDIPNDVAEFIRAKIIDEIWYINSNEFDIQRMWYSAAKYMDAVFEAIPFEDIINPIPEEIPDDAPIQSPIPLLSIPREDSVWQLDLFISKALALFSETAAPGLEPLRNIPDITLNMSHPTYLRLAGDVHNLTFAGISNPERNDLFSSPSQRYFIIMSYFKIGILAGSHNLNGTVTIAFDGQEIPVGGGGERNFLLRSFPAMAQYRIRYSITPERKVQLYQYAEISSASLIPGEETGGFWDVDFGGLLDPVNDPALKDNAIYWILRAITIPIQDVIAERIEYRMHKVLQAEFDKTTWDEIISNPTPLPPRN